MKRSLSLMLCMLLAITMQTSCDIESTHTASPFPVSGVQSSPSPDVSGLVPTGLQLPIVTDGSVTLKIWFSLEPKVIAQTDDLADGSNFAWSEAMKRTGIRVEFIHPVNSAETEQFQLMIASSDHPDIYKGFTSLYAGGLDKAVSDNVWLRLNTLIESFAPNYLKWVNSSENDRKNAITDSGNMVCFCQVYDRLQPAFVGYAIRQDWLDDLGLRRPETYDDWYNVLTQFKNFKTSNGAGPLELASSGIPASNAFAGGFGVNASYFIQKSGKVVFSQAESGFREYLDMMSRWYREGLIDKDFLVNGGNGYYPNSTRIANNESGAAAMMYTYAGDYLARAGIAEPGANFTLTRWPVKTAGTTPPVAFIGYDAPKITGEFGATVFSSCKYPEYAVCFIDYFYSEEGAFLANYGLEGVTYEMINGKPIQTELITKNPDGLTTTSAQARYLIHNGAMVFILDREEDAQSETALEYRDLWSPAGMWNISGNLSYTAEEGAERSALLNDISSYVSQMTVKFIMGVEELNDATWGEFVGSLKAMNVDRAVEITQAAFDRYRAR